MLVRIRDYTVNNIMVLPDLSNLRSSFANDAAYQLVGNRHFMGLLGRLRPILMSSQSGKGCKLDW